MATATPANILVALLLAGLLGTLGQGVRALSGLRKMNENAARLNASAADLFIASRLIVSLLIGFVVGIATGLALSLNRILAIGIGDIDLLLGIAAAGYAGTYLIEAFAPMIKGKMPPVPAAGRLSPPQSVPPPTAAPALVAAFAPSAQPVAVGVLNPKYGVTFGSLIAGGFFSADPDDLNIHRSIRTNNPGALNFSPWQRSRLGYTGITQPDNSPDQNVTTIYRTPEHGVAAWYHWLAVRNSFPGGSFSLNDLAGRRAGAGSAAAIAGLITGWNRWLNPPLAPDTQQSVADTNTMAAVAKAMFSHEAGVATPVRDDQIIFAIERERAGTLPA